MYGVMSWAEVDECVDGDMADLVGEWIIIMYEVMSWVEADKCMDGDMADFVGE